MKFIQTPLKGAYVVELTRYADHRGFFSRFFCTESFKAQGLTHNFVQCNISRCNYKGTVRGLHYQVAPATEAKFIRCTRGEILDVLVDMRPKSPTYLQSYSIRLSEDAAQGMYIPEMFAHGYQALQDNTEVMYFASCAHNPSCEQGVRYNDPAVEIEWPTPITELSDKDKNWPLLRPSIVSNLQ